MILASLGIIAGKGVPIFAGLLDTYSGATGAYSVRKLRTSYTGSAIRVRRSSDNTSLDIGFVNNELDTTTLLSFVGSNDGFITLWYDQTGNGYDLSQNTSANQPSIVLSGVLNTQNSKPVIITNGSSFMTNNSLPINGTTNSIFTTIKLVATRGLFTMISGNSAINQLWPSRSTTGFNRYYDSLSDITINPLPNGYNLINTHENSSGITVYENNVNIVSNYTHGTTDSSGIIIFKRDDGFRMPSGSGFSEIVIYGASSRLTDNTGISNNINTYYSIY